MIRPLPLLLLTCLLPACVPGCAPAQRDVAFRHAAAIGQFSRDSNTWLCHRLSVDPEAPVSILLPNGKYVPIQQLTPTLLASFDNLSTSPDTRAIAWRMPDSTGNRWVLGWERVEQSGWGKSNRALGRYIITFDGKRVRQVELAVPSIQPDDQPAATPLPAPTLSTLPPATAYPMPLPEHHLATLFGPVLQRRDYRNQ